MSPAGGAQGLVAVDGGHLATAIDANDGYDHGTARWHRLA